MEQKQSEAEILTVRIQGISEGEREEICRIYVNSASYD